MAEEAKIVKNASQAVGSKYSYSYSSLADIVKQGFTVPAMRIAVVDGMQFVEFKDDDGNWQQGAQVVPLDSGSMNSVQKYGASLTYARRYTTLMALGLVCDDDDKIEAEENRGQGNSNHPATEKQIAFLNRLYAGNDEVLAAVNSGRLTIEQAKTMIDKKMSEGRHE